MDVLDELGQVLVDAGVGVITPSASRTIFKTTAASLPELTTSRRAVLSLIEYGGTAPTRTMRSKTAYRHPSVQIVCRGITADDAHDLAKLAYNALAAVTNVTISGTWYLDVSPTQEPFDMGLDDKGRPRYGFNVRTFKGPSGTA